MTISQTEMQGSQFISLIFLAYHLITQVPAKTFLEKRAVFEKPDPSALPVGDPELLSGDVVFNMVVHWKSELDLLEKLCTSLFLLNVLQATNYFTDIEDPQTGLETLAFNIQVSDLIEIYLKFNYFDGLKEQLEYHKHKEGI